MTWPEATPDRSIARLACAVFLLALATPAFTGTGRAAMPDADGRPMVTVPHLTDDSAPAVDVEQSPWDRAARLSGFVALESRRLAERPTSVYLFCDRTALWIALRCDGRGRGSLRAEIAERDGHVWTDDSVEVFLQPDNLRRGYYQIIVNPAGVVYDAKTRDASWNGGLIIETAVDDAGWTAVLGVPFSELGCRPPAAGDTWRVNFCRNDRNDSAPERSSWAPVVGSFLATRYFGELVFGDGQHAARFGIVEPLRIGHNELLFESTAAGTVLQTTGVGERGQPVFEQRRDARPDGRVDLFVDDDRARRIELAVRGPNRQVLGRCWYPLESPEIAGRVQRLRTWFDDVAGASKRYPADARQTAAGMLARVQPPLIRAAEIVQERARRTPDNWQQLADVVPRLERELNDAWCYARTLTWCPQADFAVGLASPMTKVMIRDFPFTETLEDHYDLALARNEHEGLQVVVIPYHADLKNVSVAVSPLTPPDGQRVDDAPETTVALVGHVDVADDPPYETDHHGWWPDPLLSFQQRCDVARGEHVAFWVDVATVPQTPAGDYHARITVTADGSEPVEMRLNVRVWDFALADGSHLPTAFTFDQPSVARVYGDQQSERLLHEFHDLILDHRLGIDHLYRGRPPDLGAVEYSISRGAKVFNVMFAGQGGRGDEFFEVLADFVPKLRAGGLIEHAYLYGFDEVSESSFADVRELFGAVHRRFPGLKTMTTAGDPTFGRESGLREAVDIWVPLTPHYDRHEAEALRSEGRDMWWYVCVTPHHPYANWFIEYPAIEARLLLGAKSWKYRAGGFLYYQTVRWVGNTRPIASGPYTTWNPGSFTNRHGKTANGDGSLLCPGPEGPLSTIRLENIRDGLEDYEYLHELRSVTNALRESSPADTSGAFLDRADALLAVPRRVVHGLTDFTRDPAALDRFRQDVAEAILEGRRLLKAAGEHAR